MEVSIPSIEYEEDIVTGIKIVDATISEDRIALSKSQIKQEDNPVNSDVQKRVIISSSSAFPFYRPHPDRIINFTDADVLCGRGGRGTTIWHVGNIYYRSLCKEYHLEYSHATKGKGKNDTVNNIIDNIRSKGGRFLRDDKSTGIWTNISHIKAREKIKQVLREGLSELRTNHTRRQCSTRTSML